MTLASLTNSRPLSAYCNLQLRVHATRVEGGRQDVLQCHDIVVWWRSRAQPRRWMRAGEGRVGGGAEAPTSTVQRGAWSTVSEPEAPTSTVQRGAWSTVSEPEAPTSTVQRGAWATVSEPPAAAPAAPAAPDEDDEDEIAWES